MKSDAAALLAKLTGIPQKKIDPLLEIKSVSEFLVAPGMIPGISQEQMRRVEALNEFSRAYSAAGHSYTLDNDSGQIARYLYGIIGGQRQENLVALLYDKNKELVRAEKISKGGVASTTLDPIILGRLVSENGAKHVILAHNHPSGDPSLSQDDRQTAATVRTQLSMLGCKLEDAFVIGSNTYCSENAPYATPIPAARPEIVLFPNAQKEQDERKIQDLLSVATGVRRSTIENWMEEGHALSEAMCEPQDNTYGLDSSDAGKIALATKIAERATTEGRKYREQICGPNDAAVYAAKASSNNAHDAGVIYMDIRHRVVEESAVTWPLTMIGCNKIAREAYKNNVSSVLLYRVGEHFPAQIEEKDKTSVNRAVLSFSALNIEMVDVIILSKQVSGEHVSLREQGKIPDPDKARAGLSESATPYESQRRTRR